MKMMKTIMMLVAGFAVFAVLAPTATAADDVAATVRANTAAWVKAYNTGNADAIVALYADDAVVLPPGAGLLRGHAAIKQFIVKDIAGAQAAGVAFVINSGDEVGTSGDLAWHSGTFKVTDKSGATVDTGKYLEMSRKRGGKWHIIRDMWNSDTPPPASAPAPAPAAPKK
jgi:uncharacterized protein (TIGR02246 family)